MEDAPTYRAKALALRAQAETARDAATMAQLKMLADDYDEAANRLDPDNAPKPVPPII